MNMYAYCGNSPVGLIDPLGLRAFDPIISPYDPPFVTFEFMFPALAVGSGIRNDDSALATAKRFFDKDNWTGWNWDDPWKTTWQVWAAHLEDNGTDIHVQFLAYYDADIGPPPTPVLGVGYLSQWRRDEPIITLNGIGLLERWKFDRVMRWHKWFVRAWPRRPFGPHLLPTPLEAAFLVGLDSPFSNHGRFRCSIDKFEWGRSIYDNSQVNYYLQGYAMRHLNLWYRVAQELVLQWKSRWAQRRVGRDELTGEFYWFDMGWSERGFLPW